MAETWIPPAQREGTKFDKRDPRYWNGPGTEVERAEFGRNLSTAQAAITGLDGPTRDGLLETISAWGYPEAQHALELVRPDRAYTDSLAGWTARITALADLADAEGLPPRTERHWSEEAAQRHPMNVLDGSTWYEGLKRDVFDEHRRQAGQDLRTLEQQGSLSLMRDVMDHGPYGVEQSLRRLVPVGYGRGIVHGELTKEALDGRRAACKTWIQIQQAAIPAETARGTGPVVTNAAPAAPDRPRDRDAYAFDAGRRSMETTLGKLSDPEQDRLAWQIRTIGLDDAETGLRDPGIAAGTYGPMGIEGRKNALADWFTVNQTRDGAAAMHAAMAGRPQAQIVAPEAAPAEKADGAAPPAHGTGVKPRRDTPAVGG